VAEAERISTAVFVRGCDISEIYSINQMIEGLKEGVSGFDSLALQGE